MASRCFRPIPAFQQEDGTVSFSENAYSLRPLDVRCGKCVGCRMYTARSWAIRCAHEACLHVASSFVTLTFCDETVPLVERFGVVHRPFQLFMKRLRKDHDVRYFMCFEYGPTTLRPHFHALLFGVALPGPSLEEYWQVGNVRSTALSPARVAYTTGYTLKDSPAPRGSVPPYRRMSRRPGLGSEYFNRYRQDFLRGFAVWDGREASLPTFYRRKFTLEELEALDYSRWEREEFVPVEARIDRRDWDRQKVAEHVAEAKVRTFQRRDAL